MRKLVTLMIAAAVVYVAIMIVPIPINGALNWLPDSLMSPAEYNVELKANLSSLAKILSGMKTEDATSYGEGLGLYLRQRELLQMVGAMVVGAGLSVVGAVFQGSFRNSIASPTTLGVMSGGQLASTIYIMWGVDWTADNVNEIVYHMLGKTWGGHLISVFAGCLGAVIFTSSVAKLAGRGKSSMVTLIVVGMVFSSACGSVSSLISYTTNMSDPYSMKAVMLQTAMAGRINESATWGLLIVIGAMLVILQLMAKKMNLLVFGEDEARAMGINVKRLRLIMMGVCTLLTAVVIATCGGISFIGLIIPHIARRYIGSDFRYLLPACMVIGGMFLLICNVIPPFDWMSNYHVGNYASIVGGIVFLYMILRNRRGNNADWA